MIYLFKYMKYVLIPVLIIITLGVLSPWPIKTKSIEAYITAYSLEDSCHFEGCVNASGWVPSFGEVACPRDLALGTMVKIQSEVYVCTDRYAKWVDEKRGLPTFDIFMEEHRDAKSFGIHKLKVEILN